MDDLGCDGMIVPRFDPASNWSANLGRLYVLEGSSVGARLLYSLARRLEFTEHYGARHLALQVNEVARWKQFRTLLDTIEGVDIGEALSGAQELFEFAIMVYSGHNRK